VALVGLYVDNISCCAHIVCAAHLQVVEAYKKKAVMREGMRTIGRQTLFVTGVAALYFGVELGVGMAREQQGHWANTAAAGAVAGGYLGARGRCRIVQ
jgi:hypothetical protein